MACNAVASARQVFALLHDVRVGCLVLGSSLIEDRDEKQSNGCGWQK
jgi:hypothetical protein